MQGLDKSAGGWAVAMPHMSDEGLLLAELSHRVRNEVCASVAAMQLSLSRRNASGREDMVRAAISRLEGFGEVLGVMAVAPGETVNLKPVLIRMCEGMQRGRSGLADALITVDASDVRVSGDAAARIMMVAHELVHNAMRHALDGRRGMLAVVLRGHSNEVRLAIIDDGPGIRRGAASGGTGMGSPFVEELVRRGGGSISSRSSARGTHVRVRMMGTPVVNAAGEWEF